MKKTDEQLLKELIRNDKDAFEELYIRYKDRLWNFCFSFIKTEDETDDMVQDVFIKLWENRTFLNPELSFSPLLYTMARNRTLNYLRDVDTHERIRQALMVKKSNEEESVETQLIYKEYQQILAQAVEKLPAQQKRVFHLSRIENLSHKEIAERLGISVYTVQEHISEALRFIKDYFSRHSDLFFVLLFAGML